MAAEAVVVIEQLRRRVPGGIGRYVTGLVHGLTEMADAGEEVPALALYASRPPSPPAPLAVDGWDVVTSSLPGPVLTRAWDHGLLDVPGRARVIHAPSLATPPARHGRLVVTVHDMAWRTVPETFPARGRRWHEAAFGRALARAARLVVPSEETAAQVLEAGAETGSIVMIPHGADHLSGLDRASADRLLERLGVTGDFLLSVGTLEPRKNLARLVEAYGRARPLFPEPWPLVVVGPTGWGDAAAHGQAPGPHPGVVATGPVDDRTLAALYEKARLLVYVPLTEGFGFPPVEAMRQRLPVVASPMPSLGGAGLVVDPTNTDDIVAGLVRVATDEALRSELVAGGVARTETMTWVASARRHVALWESLL